MKVQINGHNYTAKVTTEHPASSYNLPVLVLETHRSATAVDFLTDGGALGTADVQAFGVKLVEASDEEVAALVRAGYVMPWVPRS